MVVRQRIPFIWVTLTILFNVCNEVQGHGHLWSPPQRSSMWRMGFPVPANYNDVGLNCGGFDNQWNVNHGRCGPCGDPYQGPHKNDYGGTFDTGTIGATYKAGERISVKVHLTAFHLGYFVFHLCEKGSLQGDLLQDCLDKIILPVVKKHRLTERYHPQKGKGVYTLKVQLPPGLSCRHCVLQWVYRVGNSWGTDKEGAGLGHGPQEHFINCADIKIRPNKDHAHGHAHDHAPNHADWYRRFLTDYSNVAVTIAPTTTTCATTISTTTTTVKPKKRKAMHPFVPTFAQWMSSIHHHNTANSQLYPNVNDNSHILLGYGANLNKGFITPPNRFSNRQAHIREREFNPNSYDHVHIHLPYNMPQPYRNLVPMTTPVPWKLQTVSIQQTYSNQRNNPHSQALNNYDTRVHIQHPGQKPLYRVALPPGSPSFMPQPIRNHYSHGARTQLDPKRHGSYIIHEQLYRKPQQYIQEVLNNQGREIIQQQQYKKQQRNNQEVPGRRGTHIIQQQQNKKQRRTNPEVTRHQGSHIIQQQPYKKSPPNNPEVQRTTSEPRKPKETSYQPTPYSSQRRSSFQSVANGNTQDNQQANALRTTPAPVTSQSRGSKPTCEATGAWSGQRDMSVWCQTNCPQFCPSTHCKCR